jgi:hypothetical protein
VRTKLFAFIAGIGLLAAAAPARAHHSFSAEFDAQLPATLRGTITKVERVNPHGWIFIDVKGPDGKVVNWAIETGGPLALARRGVTKDTLPIGMEIIATGFRAKNGSPTINGEDIRLPDGRKLFVGSSAGDTPYAARAKEVEQGSNPSK